jgi:RNA polymerase sigma-70 factor (ECF subfamily)
MITQQAIPSLFSFSANNLPYAASPSPTIEPSSLVGRAQRGDRSAVAQLYQEYIERIYRYILYRVPSSTDAEEITAEVFVSMVKALPSYRITGAPFEAWLYRIAGAQIANYYRQAKRQQQAELSENMADSNPSPEEAILEQQNINDLRSALSQLSEEDQTILTLRFVERKSHEEVAALLDKTVSAVKNAQYHALTRLTQFMGAEHKARHYLRGSHR